MPRETCAELERQPWTLLLLLLLLLRRECSAALSGVPWRLSWLSCEQELASVETRKRIRSSHCLRHSVNYCFIGANKKIPSQQSNLSL